MTKSDRQFYPLTLRHDGARRLSWNQDFTRIV